MAKWEFVEWLFIWLIETKKFKFDWDDGNSHKNKLKLNVSLEVAESIFHCREFFPLGIQIKNENLIVEDRFGIIGRAQNGQVLQIAFILRKEKIRIISARPASKKERNNYEKDIRKIIKRI